jgi:hypothetical protein
VAMVAHPICAMHRLKWCATNSLFFTSLNACNMNINFMIALIMLPL